jgi:primosomal protein N' (replication factor Y)
MITKGHDFSNVTLVGVLAADSSINVGDYRAEERTFQLLTQVAGRSGRGDKKGRAIIQTYMPDDFSIQTAQKQDFLSFYNQEIKIREKLNYPPFCDIMVAVIMGTKESLVIEDSNKLYKIFEQYFEVYSPMPAPISKINDNFRWRVLMKGHIKEKDIDIINFCLNSFDEVKNKDTKLSFDINPNNMS